MLSIEQDCKFFSSNWRPGRLQFSGHFTKKATNSALISLIFANFNKCRLKKIYGSAGTKNPILGVSAHGLTYVTGESCVSIKVRNCNLMASCGFAHSSGERVDQLQTIRQMSSVWLWEAVQRVLKATFEIFCI